MSYFPVIALDKTDSTNNYAMRLIEAGTAQHGLTVTANSQVAGKGQRGNSWADTPGESLLMSVVTAPRVPLTDQFVFNYCVAVSIANVLQKMTGVLPVSIKWPNDIIVNDKKAGGILIENVLRGSNWSNSVIGIGINVLQDAFPAELPFATSLKAATGIAQDVAMLRDAVRLQLLNDIDRLQPERVMEDYNRLLYKKGKEHAFRTEKDTWLGTIVAAHTDGSLEVKTADGVNNCYFHGQIGWVW